MSLRSYNVCFLLTGQQNCDVRVGGSCYRLFSSPATWAEANQACQQNNGALASIMTQQEEDELTQAAQRQNLAGVWLGGQEVKTDWHWTGKDQVVKGLGG